MALELYKKKTKHFLISLSMLIAISIVVALISLSIGPSMLDPREVFKVVFLRIKSDESIRVIAMLRVSRTVASYVCGIALSLAGLLMQTITRNPLADPYIFGLSSSALTAIAIAALISPSITVYKYNLVVIAFAGAIIGYLATVTLAKLAGGDSLALVLAGIAVASLFSGLSHVLLYMVQNIIRTPYVYFLMGSAATVTQRDLGLMTYPIIALIIVAIVFFKPLNTYLYGDEYAKQLGFNPRLVALIATGIAALSTAIIIAFIGIVGFVGLAAPHIARFFVGSDHKFSIPIAVLVGGSMTVLADIVVRLVSMYSGAVGELPLGVITSIIGAPFLAYLIVKRMRQ
ncbi:MAG: iron ABC transporter permease [Ignisphaera sp.]